MFDHLIFEYPGPGTLGSQNIRIKISYDGARSEWRTAGIDTIPTPTTHEQCLLVGYMPAASVSLDRREAKHSNIQDLSIVSALLPTTNIQKLCWRTCISCSHAARTFHRGAKRNLFGCVCFPVNCVLCLFCGVFPKPYHSLLSISWLWIILQ